MTDGFIGKLKLTFSSKERKHEKILRASYRAGKRQAHAELGSATKDTSSLSALSSDNEQLSHAQGKNTTGTAAPGQTFGSQSDPAAASAAGAALGTGGGAAAGYGALKKGRVVSLPPKRSREPLDKDWGGDYANEKRPEEVAGGTGADSSKAVLDNSQPRYDNEASPVLGKGKFYDPKDTQGGVYGSSGSNSASGSTSGHGGAYAGAAGAGAAGAGLGYAAGRGGSGSGSGSNEYTEATQQEVSSYDNLKTKPTAYAEQDKQEAEANKVSEQAYAKGQRQAKELHQQGKEKARAEAEEGKIGSGVNEQEEHAHNKSAYNQGGVKQAYREVTGGKSEGGSNSGSNAGYAAAGAGAGAAGGAAAGSALGSKGSKDTQDARSNIVHAGEPPSGDKFDYDSEIKRLDQNIATTQKEIDEIHNNRGTLDPRAGATSSSGAVPASSGSSAPGGSSASKTSSGSGRALAGAGTGAAVGAGAGYAAKDRSSESHDQTKATNQPGTSSSTGPASAGAATGTSRDATTHQSKTEQFKEYYDAGVKKGAYDAGQNAGQNAGQGSYGAQGAQGESSGHGPGLVAGAAGAVGAAGVLASRAFGLGGSQDASRESDPQAEAQAKQAEIQAKQADAQKAESDSQLARSENSSYLDSAKGAIGAAFGYGQGLNEKKDDFTHDSQTTGSKAAHPRAVSTGGDPSLQDPSFRHPETAAAAGSVDTRNDPDHAAREAKNVASDKTSQSSGGFLSRFGLGGDNKSETSTSEEQKREEPTQSGQSGQSGNNSTLGAIAGAVTGGAIGTGASSALGGSSSGTGSEKSNLVETAAANSREVDEQPKHKGNKNATVEAAGDVTNKEKDDVQQVPGLEPKGKREDSEKDTKLTPSSLAKLEEEVAAHNKKHGIKNDGRSLIDIAEQEDPLILKLHHAKGLQGALDLGGEEVSSGAKDDVQQVPDVALHSKSEFINLGGKVGLLGDVGASEATRSETNTGASPRHRTPH